MKRYLFFALIISSAFAFSLFFFGKNNIPFQNKVSAAGTCDLVNADDTINHCRPLNRGCDTRFEEANTTVDASCGTFLNIPSPNEKAVCCKMKTFSVTPTVIPGTCPTIRSDGNVNYCIPQSKGTCAANSYSDTTAADNDACTNHLYGVPGYCCNTNKKIVVTSGAGSTPGATGATPGGAAGGTYRLSGRVYIDNNKNNQFDSGDKAEPDVKLNITSTVFATTNSEGQYSFAAVASGSRTITGTVKEGANEIRLNRTVTVTRDITGEDFIITMKESGGPVVGSGSTPTPTGSSSTSVDIQGIINSVSEIKIKEYLTNLVDDDNKPGADELQSRWSTYDGNGGRPNGNKVEGEYIKNYFTSLGLDTSLQSVTSNYATNNVIARLPGTNADDTYLIVGHYDSRGDSNVVGGPNEVAPGADDNGTGTAIVMEAARVIKNSGKTFKSSIEFIAFSGEEQGLYGSKKYVSTIPSGKQIKGVFDVDMIGNNGGSDCITLYYGAGGLGSGLSSKVIDINNQYSIGLQTHSELSTVENSDHSPFQGAGKQAVMAAECVFSPAYHRPTDRMNLINFSQVTKAAKSIIGALAILANE